LYQGATSVVPIPAQIVLGFSPCALYQGTNAQAAEILDSLKGPGLSRAAKAAKSIRLQPLRDVFSCMTGFFRIFSRATNDAKETAALAPAFTISGMFPSASNCASLLESLQHDAPEAQR